MATPGSVEIGSKEAVAQAVVRKEKATTEAGKKIAERVRKNEDPTAIVESMRKIGPVNAGEIEASHNRGIGRTLDASGSLERKGDQETRFNRAKAATDRVNKLLDIGVDRLTKAEQKDLRSLVKDKLARMSPPLLAEQLKALDPNFLKSDSNPEVKAILDSMLKDPKFQEALKSGLTDAIDAKWGSVPPIPKELQDRFDAARKAKLEAESKATQKSTELRDVNADLAKYQPGGEYARDMARWETDQAGFTSELQGNITTAKRQVEQATITIATRKRELEEAQTAGDRARISAAERALIDARLHREATRQVQSAAEARMQRIPTLEDQKAALTAKAKQLETEFNTLTVETTRFKAREQEAQTLLKEAESAQEDYELAHVSRMEGLVGEAAQEYFSSKMEEAIQAQQEEMKLAIENEKNEERRGQKEALNSRYNTTRESLIRKREKPVLKKKEVKEDYNVLIKDGPDALMKRIHGDDVDLNDEELKQMTVDMLLSNRVRMGPMAQNEVQAMINTTWGADMLKNWTDKHNEAKSVEKAMIANGSMKEGDSNKRWMLYTLAALGLPLAGAFALPALGVGALATAGIGTAGAGIGGTIAKLSQEGSDYSVPGKF